MVLARRTSLSLGVWDLSLYSFHTLCTIRLCSHISRIPLCLSDRIPQKRQSGTTSSCHLVAHALPIPYHQSTEALSYSRLAYGVSCLPVVCAYAAMLFSNTTLFHRPHIRIHTPSFGRCICLSVFLVLVFRYLCSFVAIVALPSHSQVTCVLVGNLLVSITE